jgi:hypothetical protein
MTSKERIARDLNNADALAGFANLESDQIEPYRQKHPDFFPETFWPENRTGFSIAALNAGVAGFDWQTYQTLLRQAWAKKFPSDLTIRLLESSGMGPSLEVGMGHVYPYQNAVMLLHDQSWRAKICEDCHNRYVADHAKRKYCSTKCSELNIAKSHLKWWRDTGKKRRSAKARGK